MNRITVDVIVGKWGGQELFIFQPQPCGEDEKHLPLMIGGEKLFLTREMAKELADKLLEFVST